MPLSDIVSVTITSETAVPTLPGFAVPMILGYHTKFAERIRFYSSLAAMVSDGFTSTMPEYKAASAIFAQENPPDRVAIGRRTRATTAVWNLTPAAVSLATYGITIGTEGEAAERFTYTADGSATVQEIVEGLVAAIGANVTGVTPTEDNTKVILTGTAGKWISVEVDDDTGNPNGMGQWTVADVSTNPGSGGVEGDLADVAAASSDWYGVILTHGGEAEINAAATWTEANKRLMIAKSSDTAVKTSSSTDIASDIETAAYVRTAIIYHHKPAQFADAAWFGALLAFQPGSVTWKFKTLAGVDASILTDTETGLISGKHANWYQEIAGINMTQEGWTGGGEFIDVTHFADWQASDIQAAVFTDLVNSKKIPFTDPGLQKVGSAIKGSLQRGVDAGGITSFTLTVPEAADISTVNKGLRHATGFSFSAPLQGAIHKVTLEGTVTL